MFLLPGVVVAWYVTGTTIPASIGSQMMRYLFARQHPQDGGWGLHTEGESTVFGTAMNYVVLRILGVGAEEPRMVRARAKLHALGGAVNGPHWAKMWLSVLGVMEWDAVNPVPPELWFVWRAVPALGCC
jgi:lanosterol synthase